MSKVLSATLLDRLVCAKYIYTKGVDILSKGETFSAGLATLHFQDAIELFLRTVAEYKDARIKDSSTFHSIIDKINEVSQIQLTHRSQLNQLNKSRVNFKHYGIEPTVNDARKFRQDTESFLVTTTKDFFDLKFETISLVNLIGYQRVENFLNSSEKHLLENNYSEAVNASAIAFAIYQKNLNRFSYDDYYTDNDVGLDHREFMDWKEGVDKRLIQFQEQFKLLSYGVRLIDFERFNDLTPTVDLAIAGNYFLTDTGYNNYSQDDTSYEDALYCYRFVVDSILLIHNNRLPHKYDYIFEYYEYEVVKDTDIIVYPMDNIEVIRIAKVGEVLKVRVKKSHGKPDSVTEKDGYLEINQDNDNAYVKEDSIKRILV